MKEDFYSIETSRGTLRGMKHIPDNPKGIVIMYHGFTGTSVEPMYLFTYLARAISKMGYIVVRMDYLGCGNSDGYFKDQSFGKFLDQSDLIYQIVKKEYDFPISILGLSMGGAICTELSKRYEFNNVILMSPAISMKELMDDRSTNIEPLNGYYDLGGMLMGQEFIDEIQHYNFYEKQDTNTNVLVFAPTNDQTVLYEEVKKYIDVYNNIEIISVEGADHVFSKYIYRVQIEEGIKKNLI